MQTVRQAGAADYPGLAECVRTWWRASRAPDQARELCLLLPRRFLQHLVATGPAAEDESDIRAFLLATGAENKRERSSRMNRLLSSD